MIEVEVSDDEFAEAPVPGDELEELVNQNKRKLIEV